VTSWQPRIVALIGGRFKRDFFAPFPCQARFD